MEELKLTIEELEERIAPGNLSFPGETECILTNPGTSTSVCCVAGFGTNNYTGGIVTVS
jgi:hypothetical protein